MTKINRCEADSKVKKVTADIDCVELWHYPYFHPRYHFQNANGKYDVDHCVHLIHYDTFCQDCAGITRDNYEE